MTAQNRVKENFQSKKGFTLIELMVAMAIVAILATIGMVMYSSTQATARDAKRRADLEDIKKAIYIINTSKGGWCANYSCPAPNGWYQSANSTYGMNGSADISMKKAFIDTGLLKAPLHDPKCPAGTCESGSVDYFLQVIADDKFTIYAKLENDNPTLSIGCNRTAVTGYNYCVSP